MDFRTISDRLANHEIGKEEIVTQILNLPCVYALFQGENRIFCLEVFNEDDDSDMTIAMLYSNLDLALMAVKEFEAPSNWYIAQWSDVNIALNTIIELGTDGVAFDSLPDIDKLGGLVIDKISLKELVSLCC